MADQKNPFVIPSWSNKTATDQDQGEPLDGSESMRLRGLEVPGLEGIGFWHRASTYFLDTLILNGLLAANYFVVVVAMVFAGETLGFGVNRAEETLLADTLLNLGLFVVYFALFEWLFGATPGKAMARLRVVKMDGSPCTLGAAIGRGFARLIDGLFFGLVAALNMRGPLKQRWGDKRARTLVVRSDARGIRQPKERSDFARAFVAYLVLQSIMLVTYVASALQR